MGVLVSERPDCINIPCLANCENLHLRELYQALVSDLTCIKSLRLKESFVTCAATSAMEESLLASKHIKTPAEPQLRVLEDGLATTWNASNPTRPIAAGDRILEVNGEALSPEDCCFCFG